MSSIHTTSVVILFFLKKLVVGRAALSHTCLCILTMEMIATMVLKRRMRMMSIYFNDYS